MRISQINGVRNYHATRNGGSLRKSNDSSFQVNASEFPTEESRGDIWKELGGRYDVRNATFDEICELGQKLYEAEEISLEELGSLTINLSKLDGVKSRSNIASFYEGRKDWIKAFTVRAENQLSYGNKMGYQNLMNVTRFLEKVGKASRIQSDNRNRKEYFTSK